MTQMMEALRRFAEDCAQTHFQRLPHEIIIERAVDFVEKTEVQPRVFRIKNLHSNLLFVVKFYPSERFDITMIEHLAAAGGMLGQLKLQKSVINLPFAISQCIEGQTMYYLIAFPAAEGHSLWFYLENGDADILHVAMQKMALSLAELHLKALNVAGEISSTYALQEEHALRFFQKMMKNSPEVLPLDVATITKRFHQLRIEMLAFPSPTGWIHGDAMIHHFFYAIETDKMTLIDFDRFIFAILTDKKMGGPIAYDYAFVINSLWQLGIYAGIDQKVLQRLEKDFTGTYQAHMGNLFPSEQSIRYYSFIYCLKKACLTSKRLEHFSHENSTFIKLNHMLQHLVNKL
ncbi:putative uncharacterized protein [Parachlamydia acanthamoebae UV-7]|jgi:hypothetical protein|uniref:Aminoglycoside phosphotransferase domain-containing protein n=2 Tax=Parachlamydia acanthamoebae TaxID=83552 RepID=F8L098_PARAV|nr:phosphotransferase [Parachlamydia acanthamoebae]EFB41596.1 hypothetical protein pah_c026o018 [Parachlamydia acanthamoebae str. Hall's coccus]KIA77647.1 hypothetical protein DB43_GB00090 [Parachlamydia acanthamoebae]CCB86628.1 putative uncharacterized protein [Parachlamydia acanthamoebae UV-7]